MYNRKKAGYLIVGIVSIIAGLLVIAPFHMEAMTTPIRFRDEVKVIYHDFGAASPYEFIILAAANQYDVEPEMIAAIILTESCVSYSDPQGNICAYVNPWARSATHDRGLMQINEAHYGSKNPDIFYVPAVNIFTGTRLFREALNARGQNVYMALSAYNTGIHSAYIQHAYAKKALRYYNALRQNRKTIYVF